MQHAAGELGNIGFAQHLRHGAYGDGAVAHGGAVEAVLAQQIGVFGQGGHFFVAGFEAHGNEQLLAVQAAVALALGFHFFVVHALGGGVHVD